MTLKELQVTTDSIIALMLPDLQQYQSTYKGSKETYWQGHELCSSIPEDGQVAILDRKSEQVKSKVPTWNESGLTAKLNGIGCSVRCDEYQTPESGFGFVLIATFIWQKDTYYRAWNSGPEKTFDRGWSKVNKLSAVKEEKG